MQNNNRKMLENLVSRTKIYLAIILFLLIILSVQNIKYIIPSIILYVAIVGYTYYANRKRKSEISETLQDLTLTVDSAAKTSLINSPFPLIIFETDGNVIWRSSRYISEFADIDMNSYINELSSEIKKEIKTRKKEDNIKNSKDINREITIENKNYKIFGRYVHVKNRDKKSNEYMIILYFIDETENVKCQITKRIQRF